MANPYARCGPCKGNFWPSGLKEHKHLTTEELVATLKLKHRTRGTGRNVPAKPRTNSPRPNVKTIAPRRRAYGPF